MSHDRPPARQTDLAAMGVPAQVECAASRRSMVGHFSGMHEGKAENSAIWCGPECRQCCLRVEAVDVIKANDVKVLAALLQPERALEQHLETLLVQRLAHGG